jgi:hypothetical protein
MLTIYTMKKILILYVFLAFSCQKDDSSPYFNKYWGQVQATKNGQEWKGKVYALYNEPYNQGLDIIVSKVDAKGDERESLSFYKIPVKIGIYPISMTEVRDIDSLTGAFYTTFLAVGDVLGDVFHPLLTDEVTDYVEISEIRGLEIFGKFQVSLVKIPGTGEVDPSAPDTIVFNNGIFHTRIVNAE